MERTDVGQSQFSQNQQNDHHNLKKISMIESLSVTLHVNAKEKIHQRLKLLQFSCCLCSLLVAHA